MTDTPAEDSETAGTVYSKIIAEQFAIEQSRKASLEQRGITVTTTSGVLVSLLFGLANFVIESKEGAPSAVVRVFLSLAIASFVLAGAFALVTNRPRAYMFLAMKDLERMVTEELWNKRPEPALRRVAENQVKQLKAARALNEQKAGMLGRAILAEMMGVGFVGAGVVALLV